MGFVAAPHNVPPLSTAPARVGRQFRPPSDDGAFVRSESSACWGAPTSRLFRWKILRLAVGHSLQDAGGDERGGVGVVEGQARAGLVAVPVLLDGLLELGERREGRGGRRRVFRDDERRVHAHRLEEVGGEVEAGFADALDQGVLVRGEEADGVFKKEPFVDDKSFRRPAELFA